MEFFVVGFAPGIFWLWLIFQRDRYLPAPLSLVVRTFTWGAVAAIPIALVEVLVSPGIDLDRDGNSVVTLAYVAFIVAGGVEEIGKAFVVRRTIFWSPYFRLSKDGLLYSAAAALGFASLENVGYALSFGLGVIVIRGMTSTLAHVAFSALWGVAMGYEKQTGKRAWTIIGLLGAVLLHGAFDFFLFTGHWQIAIGIFLIGLAIGIVLFRRAIGESATQRPRAEVRIVCPSCGQDHGQTTRFCSACGTPLAGGPANLRRSCGNCRAAVSSGQRFCVACGSRFVTTR